MKYRNSPPGLVEEEPPKKHKAKRKVSELDEVAAKVSLICQCWLGGLGMLTIRTAETQSSLSSSAGL